MLKLQNLMVLLVASVSFNAFSADYKQPENLRFQKKSKVQNQQINVERDGNLCTDESLDKQHCPIEFHIDDIRSGKFYANNSAKFYLKPEVYNFKVKNCTDECSVCEIDLNPQEIKDGKLKLSIDGNGLPLIFDVDNRLLCEKNEEKSDGNETLEQPTPVEIQYEKGSMSFYEKGTTRQSQSPIDYFSTALLSTDIKAPLVNANLSSVEYQTYSSVKSLKRTVQYSA